jgi:hypothetical protein
MGLLLTARLLDRAGKGIRGAPRDALITDITPAEIRGQAFGLRQSLDTIGAVAGPLLATALMLLWANDYRHIFWLAVIPGLGAMLLLFVGVQEPDTRPQTSLGNPLSKHNLKRMGREYWWVVSLGCLFYARPIQRSISDFTGTTIIRSCRAGATCDGRHEPRLCGDSLSIW